MVNVKEAVDIILNSAKPKEIYEEIYLSDCIGRICFEDIRSDLDIPTFTRSAMDGYALRFGDNAIRYKIVYSEEELDKNCCIRINTGFPIPRYSDSVIEVEKTENDNGYIVLKDKVERERNFTKKGIELKKGDVLVSKGERISARKRALLAYCGIVTLKVYQKPVVGIITTGDEVVFPSCNLEKNSVYNSNFFILDGLLKQWGVNGIYFGHTPDDKLIFKERLLYALNRCDVVLTTGGVSKGTKDYTKDVLKDIGSSMLFEKTTIKPGKPGAVAIINDKFIFSLPGWPAALYTVAYVYLKPFIMKIAGLKDYENRFLNCVLDENMHSRQGKDYFNHVNVSYKDEKFHCKSSGAQKTDNYYSLARAEGLVWLDEEKGDVEEGSVLPLLLFND